jgi:hypothetical protein
MFLFAGQCSKFLGTQGDYAKHEKREVSEKPIDPRPEKTPILMSGPNRGNPESSRDRFKIMDFLSNCTAITIRAFCARTSFTKKYVKTTHF